MKFTLKNYQETAVISVLANLSKARRRWREDGERSAFSLTAPTGAGKTVMAAAVFEALFHGNDDAAFEPDPTAVVLWFSDDPTLNEQTRFRLREAADRLLFTDLVVVQNTFNRDRFEAGKIYFLNTQKLSRSSLLVRGADEERTAARFGQPFPEMRPDLRSHTIWDTIRNTIEDPRLTLYLVLDEAHRGMRTPSAATQDDRSTIVKRLINGTTTAPPIPIVWGISATVERFNAAMVESEERSILPSVLVTPALVQESGLLKDTIVLDVPSEAGPFDTVLVRRAVDKLRELSTAWAEYAAMQSISPVHPLLILQVPNQPDHEEVGTALDAMFDRWPELKPEAVANVFGDHATEAFGRHQVAYISPERVQESTWIRVLIAKDAISTGWDCPRAEVMISFRRARDRTHITQLLGRMVRTPLARRIPGNDRLNSVECLLPMFDSASVTQVADALMRGGDMDTDVAQLVGRRVLISPRQLAPNPTVPASVWNKFQEIPSQALPQATAKPVKRLTALAHELSADRLLPDAGKRAHVELHKTLDAALTRFSDEVASARSRVLTVEGQTYRYDLSQSTRTSAGFVEEADITVITDAYRKAARIIGPDVARTYAERMARASTDDAPEDALVDAHTTIAAMGLVPEIKEYLEHEAERLARQWLDAYRVAIKSLADERQEVYRQLRAMSTHPSDADLAKPMSWIEASAVRNADGREMPLATFSDHLMCGDDGLYAADLNSWETRVLETEMRRGDFVAWYRNPPRARQDSLGITYADGIGMKLLRPDFLFFAAAADGSIVVDIVDPHGTQLSDALPKLRGLAQYAELYNGVFRRVESVAVVGDSLRVLDLTRDEVRQAVRLSSDAGALYRSEHASDL